MEFYDLYEVLLVKGSPKVEIELLKADYKTVEKPDPMPQTYDDLIPYFRMDVIQITVDDDGVTFLLEKD